MIARKDEYIFVIHSFNKTGQRCTKQLRRLLRTYNIDSEIGKDMGGQPISNEIISRIENARLAIAILTRHTKIDDKRWHPSQWCITEITWAIKHGIPCLLVVEEGVHFDDGLFGGREKVYFSNASIKGNFTDALLRITSQARKLMTDVIVPKDTPTASLIERARNAGREKKWGDVLRFSEQALILNPKSWQALLNKAVALGKLGRLDDADAILEMICACFVNNKEALSLAYHNHGCIEEIRSLGSKDGASESLGKQVEYYKKSLELMPLMSPTRASLLLCFALLDEIKEAELLLEESLNLPDFIKSLRKEVNNMGYLGHEALRKLPKFLYSILFPYNKTFGEYSGSTENGQLTWQ